MPNNQIYQKGFRFHEDSTYRLRELVRTLSFPVTGRINIVTGDVRLCQPKCPKKFHFSTHSFPHDTLPGAQEQLDNESSCDSEDNKNGEEKEANGHSEDAEGKPAQENGTTTDAANPPRSRKQKKPVKKNPEDIKTDVSVSGASAPPEDLTVKGNKELFLGAPLYKFNFVFRIPRRILDEPRRLSLGRRGPFICNRCCIF